MIARHLTMDNNSQCCAHRNVHKTISMVFIHEAKPHSKFAYGEAKCRTRQGSNMTGKRGRAGSKAECRRCQTLEPEEGRRRSDKTSLLRFES